MIEPERVDFMICLRGFNTKLEELVYLIVYDDGMITNENWNNIQHGSIKRYTYDSLIDVYFEYMDDYDCPFSKEQRAIFWKMLCEKSNHIIEVEVSNAFSNEEIEQVLALLENAQSIMNEDDYDRISKMLIEKRKC